MDARTVTRIENVYEHVDDIDLFTGGMAEKPVVGGIVGPTFACIIGQQFLNLRKGDRFWYEGGGHPGAFSPAQLQEIRKTSLARVVCDCMDDVEQLQPFAFLQPDQLANVRTPCRGRGAAAIPTISLEAWRDNPSQRPQQFSSQDLHPELNLEPGDQDDRDILSESKELVTPPPPVEGPPLRQFVNEAPTRPSFGSSAGSGDPLQFLQEDGVPPLEDILRYINPLIFPYMLIIKGLLLISPFCSPHFGSPYHTQPSKHHQAATDRAGVRPAVQQRTSKVKKQSQHPACLFHPIILIICCQASSY